MANGLRVMSSPTYYYVYIGTYYVCHWLSTVKEVFLSVNASKIGLGTIIIALILFLSHIVH
ncbi:unnamed protein product [Medioppia subpectinata]|uniref:Uncharacterized protein n=1 Tax=Medioppia subpectinata TaxID=1979941 RepID=A0A7R9L898_9ACAR|nr:unnamed protein product [Medioppia subpectinata]CAG2116808.1 unnamed protein product [Medioppia subpectinata]